MWPRSIFCKTLGLLSGANYKFDISLPLPKYYKLAEHIRSKWKDRVKHIVAYGHVADGNIHLNIVDHQMNPVNQREISSDIYKFAIQNNGSISAEHGIGREKVDYMSQIHSPPVLELMKSVKQTLDPLMLLNRGKVLNLL